MEYIYVDIVLLDFSLLYFSEDCAIVAGEDWKCCNVLVGLQQVKSLLILFICSVLGCIRCFYL